MKSKAIFFAIGIAAVALAAQDAVNFVRTYKEGEKDTFRMAITASLPIGSADISLTLAQTVKKAYDNGDADIETNVSDMHMSFGGNEIPNPAAGNPAGQGRTQRFDKFGRPVGEGIGGQTMMDQMSFLRYATFTGDKPLVVGGSVDIDQKDEKKGTHTWGKLTLSKVENGVASLDSDLKMTTKETGTDKPISMKFTSTVEVASSKLNKVDGTVTGLPAAEGGMAPDSVHIQMERVVK